MVARRNFKGSGSGRLCDQIAVLKKAVGREGVAAAQAILDNHEPDVIKLAFKQIPKGITTGLGKRIEALLANIPKRRQAEVREALETAKAAS